MLRRILPPGQRGRRAGGRRAATQGKRPRGSAASPDGDDTETTAKGGGPIIRLDEARYAVEDEPLLSARRCATDLGGTVPVAPSVGAALRFLAAAIDARSVVEIGTGCGSSGIWLLRGMRQGGVLTSVDTEPEYHRMARRAFSQAGFASNQARLILGHALDVLPRLSDGAYDMVFCDADQASYPDYLAAGLRLLRTGGIVVFDDASTEEDDAASARAEGMHVVAAESPAAAGTRELAAAVSADDRLIPLALPIAGGLLAAIKHH